MRYFFHAIGTGPPYMDDDGTEFDNDEAAMTYASVIARELAEGEGYDEYEVVVTDKAGTEIGRISAGSGWTVH